MFPDGSSADAVFEATTWRMMGYSTSASPHLSLRFWTWMRQFADAPSAASATVAESPAAHGWRIANEYLMLGEFLRGERGPICSVYEGRDSLRMVLACYVSAREGRRVRIDDPAIYNV